MNAFPLIILSMFLNTSAQLLLKAGMGKIGYFRFSWQSFFPVTGQVLCNPFILSGLGVYIVSISVWMMVLSRVDVSMAYPMTSLAYILTAVASYYIFGEQLTFARLVGIGVILLGVYLVARS